MTAQLTAIATIPKAVAELNRLSALRWGEKAPTYSFKAKAIAGRSRPRTFYVWRYDPNCSPFLLSNDLWAKGSRDHVLAKLRSAIRFASTASA